MKKFAGLVALVAALGGCGTLMTTDTSAPYALPGDSVVQRSYDPAVLEGWLQARCEDRARRAAPRSLDAGWWATGTANNDVERAIFRQIYDDCIERGG